MPWIYSTINTHLKFILRYIERYSAATIRYWIFVMLNSFGRIKWISLLRAAGGMPLYYNAVSILGTSVLPSTIGFLFWGVASHLFSVAEIGIASAIISAATLIAGLAGPGLNLGIIRFLPEASNPVVFLNTIYTAILLSSVALAGLYLLGMNFWSPTLLILRENPSYAIVFVSCVLVSNLGGVVRETFVARRHATYSLAHTFVANVFRLAVIPVFANLGVLGIVASVASGYLLALAISWVGFLPRIESAYQYRPEWDWNILRAVVPFSFGSYLANILGQLSQTLLPIMAVELLGAEASGHAYISLALGGMLASPGFALALSALAEGANDPSQSMLVLTRATRTSALITVIVAALVLIVAPWILQLFGNSYAHESTSLLRWLSIAAIPMVINQSYFTWLRLHRRTGRLILTSGLTAALHLAIAYGLMPHVGIVAMGFAAVLANGIVVPVVVADFLRHRQ